LIEEIRKYELLWKSDHKDYGKHKAWAAYGCEEEDCVNAGQRIGPTVHFARIALIIADVKMENCCA